MRKTSVLALVNIILVALVATLVAQQFGLLPTPKDTENTPVPNGINTGAISVNFTSVELQTWLGIKDRLVVNNTDPAFAGDRILQWISMRNSSSGDYYQKSMEWLCFWSGQGANGEWEAVVSIYNSPNSTADFVVEVSRFTWHSLDVLLDGNVVATFPQVTDDAVSLGYATFHVSA